MKVYRDYTQEELDVQYEHRNIVANAEEFTARNRAEAERVRADADAAGTARLDVRYGSAEDQLLDIYLAPGEGPAPIVVFFHGGRWRVGSRMSASAPAESFTAAGAHFVSVDFVLFPGTDMDTLIGQCREAIAWVWRNAAEFGGDRDRLHVMGKSSGGHIGGMMVTTDWTSLHDLPADTVKSALLVSGMYDLEPVRLTFRNEWLKLDAEVAARNSAIRHLPEGGCPLVVSFGSLESDEFKRQSREFVEAWRAKGFACQLIEMPGRHHFSIDADINDPTGSLVSAMLETMGLVAVPAA